MKWGTSATYAWLWKVSGPTYKNELLFWLQTENPQLFELTKKEIAREAKNQPPAKAPSRPKQKAPSVRVAPEIQPSDPIQELGDDLLA